MCARRASRLLMLLLAGCVAQTGSFALRGLGPVALPRSLLRSSPQGFPSTGQSIVRSSLVAKLRPDKEAPRGMRRVLLSAVCLFLLVRTFLVEPYYIPSMSMYPTLLVNDQIAVEKFSRFLAPPQRGDLVVFSPPPNYLNSRGQLYSPTGRSNALVKRVIAISGDKVEVRGGVVYLNGSPVYEPYVRELARYSFAPLQVPAGAMFVLGDNRNESSDSHVWGSVPVANVIGKAFYIVWPIQRQGFVDEFMQDLQITRNTGTFMRRLQGPER